MKPNRSFGLAVLMVAVLALAVPQLAQAAGTDFGTTVTNSATITYLAGSSPITTNVSVDFLVDRVLDWTIAPSTAATFGVFPASTNNAIAFSVENTTNGMVDLLLAFPASAPAPSGGARMYLDDGGSAGVWDAGDTPLPTGGGGYYIDEMAEDATSTILLVIDVAAAATTTDTYTYEITGTVHAAGGVAVLGTVLADDSGSADISTQVQNVYNDGAGYTGGTGDVAGDGFYRTYAAFQVVNAALTATKTAQVTDDGLGNGPPNAKAIPGATIHYTITITNTGTGNANNIDITDAFPADTTYVAGTLSVTGGAPTGQSDAGPITVTGASLTTGSFMTVEFDVTID